MKVKCSGLDLSEAILKVIKASSVKTTNGILEGIKLTAENNCLTLTSTDLELAIEKRIKADVIIEGECLVPGKLFAEYIKKLTDEEIELFLNDANKLSLRYAESEGVIACLNVLEFPNLKKINEAEFFEIKQKDLKNLINKAIISVAVDDSRPILKGCLFEIEDTYITAVALDGFRLALINKSIIKTSVRLSAVVPARCLLEISRLLDDTDETVKVFIQKNYLMVDLKETVILTRLLDGDFINYRKIIPANQPISIVVNKTQLENALERAALLSRVDRNNIVKMELTDNMLVITSNSEAGTITEKVLVNTNSKELSIGFNAKYIVEVLKTVSDEFVKITFDSKIDPCLITNNKDNDYLYLILPVRMS